MSLIPLKFYFWEIYGVNSIKFLIFGKLHKTSRENPNFEKISNLNS